MYIERFIWDLDEDSQGNAQHIAEHGLSIDEVEEVLLAADEVLASNSSGRPIVFGSTSTGKYIAVVFEIVKVTFPKNRGRGRESIMLSQ
jgi:uncharacterized DUF497 family protein